MWQLELSVVACMGRLRLGRSLDSIGMRSLQCNYLSRAMLAGRRNLSGAFVFSA